MREAVEKLAGDPELRRAMGARGRERALAFQAKEFARKAAEFYDRNGVGMITDVPTSSTALAVADVAKQKRKLFLPVTPASSELTEGSALAVVMRRTSARPSVPMAK